MKLAWGAASSIWASWLFAAIKSAPPKIALWSGLWKTIFDFGRMILTSVKLLSIAGNPLMLASDQFTTSVIALDALPRKAADPPYTAFTLYLPAGNVIWKIAVPV